MSNVNLETLLHDEIETEFNELSQLSPGSTEHKAVVDELVKLMDKAIEIERIDSDCKEKVKAREDEKAFKEQQLAEEKKARWIKNAIDVAGIVLPIGLTMWGTKVTMEFEKTDTVTTTIGRGFFSRLFPKK